MRVEIVSELLLVAVPPNVLVGVVAALLSACVEIKRHHLPFKDAIMVLALAVATAGAVIEWLGIKWIWVCFLIGLISGRGADSLLQSIDATMPDFSDNLVRDVQFYIRKIIAKRFGLTMRGQETDTSDTNEASQDENNETQEQEDDNIPKPMPLSRFKQTDKEKT